MCKFSSRNRKEDFEALIAIVCNTLLCVTCVSKLNVLQRSFVLYIIFILWHNMFLWSQHNKFSQKSLFIVKKNTNLGICFEKVLSKSLHIELYRNKIHKQNQDLCSCYHFKNRTPEMLKHKNTSNLSSELQAMFNISSALVVIVSSFTCRT